MDNATRKAVEEQSFVSSSSLKAGKKSRAFVG